MSSPASRWISFLEHDLLGDHQHQELAWGDASAGKEVIEGDSFLCKRGSLTYSTENENSKGDSINDNRKRARDDISNGPQGKAGREKLRRDRMNDRFVELSAVLEPDKPPKTDKASILRDATRVINQLRVEAQQYRDINIQLQETIKELKSEKNDLREEKLSLKAEKEALEKRTESVLVLPPGYARHGTAPAVNVAGSASASPFTVQSHHNMYAKHGYNLPLAIRGATQNQSLYSASPGMSPYTIQNHSLFPPKPPSLPDHTPSSTMSQWIPPEVADVSNDHVLRPPVA